MTKMILSTDSIEQLSFLGTLLTDKVQDAIYRNALQRITEFAQKQSKQPNLKLSGDQLAACITISECLSLLQQKSKRNSLLESDTIPPSISNSANLPSEFQISSKRPPKRKIKCEDDTPKSKIKRRKVKWANPQVSERRRSQRIFYRSSTRVPFPPGGNKSDSEEELDPSWIRVTRNKHFDDKRDISKGEKDFMKMWNTFMAKNHGRVRGILHIPQGCKLFVQEYGEEIWTKGLYHQCCFHLINLQDNQLIEPKEVHEIVELLQSLMPKNAKV